MQFPSTRPIPRVTPWLLGALMVGLAFVCYWPALRGGVLWDDQAHITKPALQSLAGLRRIWFELGATQQYYPVLHSAFWLEHRLWGDATLGYHLVNVFLHAAAAGLLVLLLRRFAIPGAALAGLIFLVHPVCVESVAWISEQKNTLSLVFYLLAALAYLRFDDRRDQRGALPMYLLATALFVLALLSKSVTATLPPALLVLAWWRRGRIAWRRDVWPLLPWFAIAIAAGLFTAWVERKYIGAEGAHFDLNPVQRVLLAGHVVWFYLGKLLWPSPLIFFYPHWDVKAAAPVWTGYLIAAMIVTIVAWRFRHRSRGPLAAWLFFVGSLFPALGFVDVYPFSISYVADHFQYLASLGAITATAATITQLLARTPIGLRAALQILTSAFVVALAWQSHEQSRDYTDLRTLYRSTLAKNPDAWTAHNNLAADLLGAKSPDLRPEAIAHLEAALRLRPDYAEAHYNLGDALFLLPGRLDEAIAHYEAALRFRPDYADAHNNLGNALAKIPARRADAIAHYEAALHLNPDLVETHFNLGVALMNSPGRVADAVEQFEATLRLDPGRVFAHNNLGMLLSSDPRRAADAIAHYESAIRLQPDYADAHYNLGNLLQNIPGRLNDAIAQYREALRLQPNQPDAHTNLGDTWLKIPGHTNDAIAEYQTALRLDPNYAQAHFNLAVTLLRTPARPAEVNAHFEAFLRLWPNKEQARQLVARFRPLGP